MGCGKAREIDLAAFLADPAGAAFAEFRGHYPGCSDCMREVTAWTALEARLRETPDEPTGDHPSEEWLLAVETGSSALRPETRHEVEQHLRTCAPCRDELSALRAFDFSSLASAPPPKRRRQAAIGRVFGGIRAVVLHPAFAYGLVVLALLPTLTERLPLRRAARREHVGARVHSPRPNAPDDHDSRADELRAATHEAETAAARREAEKPDALREAESRDARLEDELRAATHEPETPAARREAEKPDALREAESRDARLEDELRAAIDETASRGRSTNGLIAGVLALQQQSAKVVAVPAPGWIVLPLAPPVRSLPNEAESDLTPVSRAELAAGVIVRIDLAGFGARPPVEIQVLSPDGSQELRQRFTSTAAPESVDVQIPAAWLTAGQYEVVLRSVDDAHREIARVRFLVR